MSVIALTTISVDGRITRANEQGTSYSSQENLSRLIETIQNCDAIVSGRKTYDAVREIIRSSNSDNLSVIMTRNPESYREDTIPDRLEFTSLPPRELIQDLVKRGKHRIAITGGSQIYTAFSKEDLIDEWQVTVEPILLGEGIPLFCELVDQPLKLLENSLLADNTILLRYAKA